MLARKISAVLRVYPSHMDSALTLDMPHHLQLSIANSCGHRPKGPNVAHRGGGAGQVRNKSFNG